MRPGPMRRSDDGKLTSGLFSGTAIFLNLVRDLLAFVKRPEPRLLQRRNVYEHILAAAQVRLDEAVTFFGIEPFHSTGSHRKSSNTPGRHRPPVAARRRRNRDMEQLSQCSKESAPH